MPIESESRGSCGCCGNCGCKICDLVNPVEFCVTFAGWPFDSAVHNLGVVDGSYAATLNVIESPPGCEYQYLSLDVITFTGPGVSRSFNFEYRCFTNLGFERITVGWGGIGLLGPSNFFVGYQVERAIPNADRDCESDPIEITFTMSDADLLFHIGTIPPPEFSGATVTIVGAPCVGPPTCTPPQVWNGTECVDPPVFFCCLKIGLTEFPYTPSVSLQTRAFPAGTTQAALEADGWTVLAGPAANAADIQPCTCDTTSGNFPVIFVCRGYVDTPAQCGPICAWLYPNLQVGVDGLTYLSSPYETQDDCACPPAYRCDEDYGCVPDAAGPYPTWADCRAGGGAGGPVDLPACLQRRPGPDMGIQRMSAARTSLPLCKNLGQVVQQAAGCNAGPRCTWSCGSTDPAVREHHEVADGEPLHVVPNRDCDFDCPGYEPNS